MPFGSINLIQSLYQFIYLIGKWFLVHYQKVNFSNIVMAILDFSLLLSILHFQLYKLLLFTSLLHFFIIVLFLYSGRYGEHWYYDKYLICIYFILYIIIVPVVYCIFYYRWICESSLPSRVLIRSQGKNLFKIKNLFNL